MQNYIKSGVNEVQLNNSYGTASNKIASGITSVQTEVVDFNSNGTINQSQKKITSINLNAIGNTNNTNSHKTFDELCMLYGKNNFSNEDILDMYKKGYVSKGMVANFIKSGYADDSSIGYLLENGAIDVDTARDMAIKTYNDKKGGTYGAGAACENYLVSNDDGKNISVGYHKYEYSKKEEKNGVTTYYNANGDVLVEYHKDKIVIPKENEVFYYLGDGNYKLERTYTGLTNQYSLNPSYKTIKETTTYNSDKTETVEYTDESSGYTTTASRASFDHTNGDAFYTIEKDGKVIACSYKSNDKKYTSVLDSEGLKNYSASNNYERMGFNNINLSEEQFAKNYNIVEEMDGYSNSVNKTTVWTDGKEYHYDSKQVLDDGSIVYTMENDMGKKTFYKNGEVGTTISTTTPDGNTFESEFFYKLNSDGTYSVRNNEFMIKYDKTGYNLYNYTDGYYTYNTHYDYYRG